jgi:hypothetical protein
MNRFAMNQGELEGLLLAMYNMVVIQRKKILFDRLGQW